MRFFSNDKDARDDQQSVDVQERAEEVNPDQAHDDHPERVQSDPVSVPQQRAGSPWSSTPDSPAADNPAPDNSATDNADAELADQERHDGTVDGDYSRTDSHGDDALRPDDSEVRHDGDNLLPSDSTTTATSEAGPGSHRSDLDQPVDLALDDKDDKNDEPETVREDTTPPDHAVSDTTADDSATTTYGPGGTVITDSDSSTTVVEETALKDDGGFADPQAVDPVTDEPIDTDDSSVNHDSPETVAPVVAAAVPAPSEPPATDSKPGSVTEPDLGTLFAAEDAQSFHDRWRDVQLRFVDSPKEATTEAARLVDEAVDQLTASLKAQKEALTGEHGEDTEKLRVELRGYRDILNRVLAL